MKREPRPPTRMEPGDPNVDPERSTPEIAAEIVRRVALAAERWQLTPAQANVLGLVAMGHSNRHIADALRCASSTVEIHMTALLAKAGCRGRTELVAVFWTTFG